MEPLNKVASITVFFWLLKVVATTLGETAGDFISMTLNLGYLAALGITAAFFVFALFLQLNAKKYHPWIFWLVIIATTTLGTEISDFIDRSLHVGYLGGSVMLILALGTILYAWYKKYGHLQVYPIFERKKEAYYWTAILVSNSLGTAFGDFLSDNLGLSFITGAIITASIIFIVVLLHYYSNLNQVILFWIAFIFTRPFGATFGDLLTKPLSKGGLDLGTLNATVVALFTMFMLLWLSQKSKKYDNSYQ
ncbi:MAG: hypothetical protein KDC24_02140 [Saprospiraceae bacterium]|nr:hypothetical protein [Saprospiraceae bacterium]